MTSAIEINESTPLQQQPPILNGTPDDWYTNAAQMTVAEEGRKPINDWYIKPMHSGYYIAQSSLTMNATVVAKTRAALKDRLRFMWMRQIAFDEGRLSSDKLTEDDKSFIGLSEEQRRAVAEKKIYGSLSATRRLIEVVTPIPPWMKAQSIMADDVEGARQLWSRRKDGRWQIMKPGTGNQSINDEVMANRNPRTFTIQENGDPG